MGKANIPSDLKEVMRNHYDELIEFVTSQPFKGIVEEMYSLPEPKRPEFVKDKLINEEYLKEKGVSVPDGILIQRSSFGDRRPTLFVVKKFLPKEYQGAWENVNLTFDQSQEKGIAKDISAWRKPIPYELQAALQALEISPEELE